MWKIYLLTLSNASTALADKCNNNAFPMILGGNDGDTVIKCSTSYNSKEGVFVGGYTNSKEVSNRDSQVAFLAAINL